MLPRLRVKMLTHLSSFMTSFISLCFLELGQPRLDLTSTRRLRPRSPETLNRVCPETLSTWVSGSELFFGVDRFGRTISFSVRGRLIDWSASWGRLKKTYNYEAIQPKMIYLGSQPRSVAKWMHQEGRIVNVGCQFTLIIIVPDLVLLF